ncbi:MAG: hypothetical protein AAGC97_02695 [Planctomycetota bacterium]
MQYLNTVNGSTLILFPMRETTGQFRTIVETASTKNLAKDRGHHFPIPEFRYGSSRRVDQPNT